MQNINMIILLKALIFRIMRIKVFSSILNCLIMLALKLNKLVKKSIRFHQKFISSQKQEVTIIIALSYMAAYSEPRTQTAVLSGGGLGWNNRGSFRRGTPDLAPLSC